MNASVEAAEMHRDRPHMSGNCHNVSGSFAALSEPIGICKLVIVRSGRERVNWSPYDNSSDNL